MWPLSTVVLLSQITPGRDPWYCLQEDEGLICLAWSAPGIDPGGAPAQEEQKTGPLKSRVSNKSKKRVLKQPGLQRRMHPIIHVMILAVNKTHMVYCIRHTNILVKLQGEGIMLQPYLPSAAPVSFLRLQAGMLQVFLQLP